jgi:hypothetical protein
MSAKRLAWGSGIKPSKEPGIQPNGQSVALRMLPIISSHMALPVTFTPN